MYEALTIQTYVNGQWHDALTLSMSDTHAVAGSRITTSYETAYLYDFYDAIESIFEHAVSVNLPANWSVEDTKGFPAFILDIIPAGHAESVCSLLDNTEPGSRLKHEVVLSKLIELWRIGGQADEVPELIFEYIRRDLLNRILGNSDNHGRNTSIFRYRGRFDLAPIYDLAPMVLDEEGVTRATKWEAEKKGSPMWREICACFAQWYDPDELYERIRGAANEFRALPDLLVEMPLAVRQSKALPVNNLDSSLALWGLL